jgi:hypothetical protein
MYCDRISNLDQLCQIALKRTLRLGRISYFGISGSLSRGKLWPYYHFWMKLSPLSQILRHTIGANLTMTLAPVEHCSSPVFWIQTVISPYFLIRRGWWSSNPVKMELPPTNTRKSSRANASQYIWTGRFLNSSFHNKILSNSTVIRGYQAF